MLEDMKKSVTKPGEKIEDAVLAKKMSEKSQRLGLPPEEVVPNILKMRRKAIEEKEHLTVPLEDIAALTKKPEDDQERAA